MSAEIDSVSPTMHALLSLVGQRLNGSEVRAFLATQPVTIRDRADGGFYLQCSAFGYSITGSRAKVGRIEIRFSERLGGIFKGELMSNIHQSDTRAEIERKLGPPMDSAGFRAGAKNPTGWIKYRVSGVTVTFAYRAEQRGLSLIHLNT